MKKFFTLVLGCCLAWVLNAVPAYQGWQTRIQADGTTIELQQMGDEFYHFTLNKDGQEVREVNGMFEVVGAAPTAEQIKARRAQSKARRSPQAVGIEPNPAPRGLIILANFKDVYFQTENTPAVMDSLLTAVKCQVNNGFGSAAQYFRDQSDGQYRPQFDVYGPVTLSHDRAYYGANDEDGNDVYPTDAVIESCILANQQYSSLNLADYDLNGDGYVDFVYVIYAGKGEADSGIEEAIWPHNYSVLGAVYYELSKYTFDDILLDGVYLNNYAMSQELSGWDGSLAGIGTFCHEFGHVIGLPDFYDTEYGYNGQNALFPADWDIMASGSYNGASHCPANYSIWEKYFMGWHTPKNLGSQGAEITLAPNGIDGYESFQVNASGTLESATKEGLNYYIENRNQQGWDTYLPASGLLIWKVDFNADAWKANKPNNTPNEPRYIPVIPSGTKIGGENGAKNVWPYGSKNSWEGVSGKPLKNITRNGTFINLTYIEETGTVIEPELTAKYYLAGSMNGWAANDNYRFVANPANEGEYMLTTTLAKGDELKVIGVQGETTKWYPEGMGNNYVVDAEAAGEVTIYFRPEGGVDGWYYGFFYVAKKAEPQVIDLDVVYCDAAYYPDYEAWEFNLYKDWDASTKTVTYPDLFIGVFAKSETKIAGTYSVADEEMAYVEVDLSTETKVKASSFSDLIVTYLGEGYYRFEVTFIGNDGNNYALNVVAYPLAYNYKTGESITLTDQLDDPTPELIEGDYAVQYIDKDAKELHSEVVTLHVPTAPVIAGFTFVGWQASGLLDEGLTLQAVYTADDPMSTPDEVEVPGNKAQKLVRQGNVYILFEQRMYNTSGTRIQ